jgi:uncharacterized membrane protein YgcG
MTSNLTTSLDEALARQQDQESLPEILAEFPDEAEALRPFLQAAAALETLQPVELPDEDLLAADRAIFMAHVGNLPPVPVSPAPMVRLKGWMAQRLHLKSAILQQKEIRPMGAIILKAVLVFSMIFGAVGGTAALSSASHPDSPLYPLKMTVEGARLALAGQPAAQASLHLAFAQERAEEMAQMAQAGARANETVQAQLQNHWQQALNLMTQSPEPEMLALLAQAEIMVQRQEKMLQTVAAAGGAAEQAAQLQNGLLAQVRAQVAFGLQDPQTFRHQFGRLSDGIPGGPYGPGQCETPGDCDGDGPYGLGGPYGYGPGPGQCETPGDCDGDGPYGPGGPNGPGPGPGQCETPGDCDGDGPYGPGGPYGHGPGPGQCETPGDCDGDGPYGPGEPNGPGQCDTPGDCDGDGPYGPGEPNGPGPGQCDTPGDCDGDGPYGPGEPNGPGPGDGDGNGDSQNGDDNGQNGDDNGQNGDDNGQNGNDNGQNGDDNGQNGGDNGGGDSGGGDNDGGDNGGGDSGGGDNGGGNGGGRGKG